MRNSRAFRGFPYKQYRYLPDKTNAHFSALEEKLQATPLHKYKYYIDLRGILQGTPEGLLRYFRRACRALGGTANLLPGEIQ